MDDISHKGGVGVLVPEQELLTEEILPYIPDDRMDDVVYINPADTDTRSPLIRWVFEKVLSKSATGYADVLSMNLDVFAQRDLSMWTSVTPHTFLRAMKELMEELKPV